MRPVDYESVTESDDNKHVPSNLSIESEVDTDSSALEAKQEDN
ncbi:ERF superfamily protein, partial (plasmid) [Borrelia hermsii YBT]